MWYIEMVLGRIEIIIRALSIILGIIASLASFVALIAYIQDNENWWKEKRFRKIIVLALITLVINILIP